MESTALTVKKDYETELFHSSGVKIPLRFELGTATWGLERTGQILWDGSTVLCRYIAERCNVALKDKRVVEIGCGCCALPAHAAASVGSKSVLATDQDCEIPLLLRNIESNIFSQRIQVRAFDWSQEGPSVLAALADDHDVDVLICADIVYELTLVSLITFFEQLFECFPKVVVYMSNTNRKHVQLFHRRLGETLHFYEDTAFSESFPNVILWRITSYQSKSNEL